MWLAQYVDGAKSFLEPNVHLTRSTIHYFLPFLNIYIYIQPQSSAIAHSRLARIYDEPVWIIKPCRKAICRAESTNSRTKVLRTHSWHRHWWCHLVEVTTPTSRLDVSLYIYILYIVKLVASFEIPTELCMLCAMLQVRCWNCRRPSKQSQYILISPPPKGIPRRCRFAEREFWARLLRNHTFALGHHQLGRVANTKWAMEMACGGGRCWAVFILSSSNIYRVMMTDLRSWCWVLLFLWAIGLEKLYSVRHRNDGCG